MARSSCEWKMSFISLMSTSSSSIRRLRSPSSSTATSNCRHGAKVREREKPLVWVRAIVCKGWETVWRVEEEDSAHREG